MARLVLVRTPIGYTEAPRSDRQDADLGPTVGQVIPLVAEEVVVGRDPCGLRFNHPVASILYLPQVAIARFHARFRRVDGAYVIEDMNSRNGTYVNGTRVFTATLADGDRLMMADFEFVFHAADE